MALHKVQTFMGNQSLLQTKNKSFVIRKSNICYTEIGLLENQFPKNIYTEGVKAEIEKIFSICPKLLINAELYDLVLAPRLKKKGYY